MSDSPSLILPQAAPPEPAEPSGEVGVGQMLPVVPSQKPAKPWLIGVLYYGPKDPEHEKCVQRLSKHPHFFDVLELTGCPYIDMGRGIIATHVLDRPEIGGVLFLDHDMFFDVAEAVRLVEAAEAAQATHGAAYSMRRPGSIIGGIDHKRITPGQKIVFFEGGEVLPASFLGMGMTAIHRSIFERLVDKSEQKHRRQQTLLELLRAQLEGKLDAGEEPVRFLDELIRDHVAFKDLPRLTTGISDAPVVPFFSHLQRASAEATLGTEGFYFGEDVSFCVRCRDNELPVGLDTRVRVYHMGKYHYGLEDVGMEVPLCTRLEVLDTPRPSVHPGVYNASVRAALSSPGELAP